MNKTILSIYKYSLIIFLVTLATSLIPFAASIDHNTYAAGDASFSISPSSGSYTEGSNLVVTVSETSNSGDNVNAVQVNMSYPSQLQYDSTSLSGPFTLCGQNKEGSGIINIGCASTTTVSGTQSIAQITFSVENTGSANVNMTSGSNIDNTSGNSVWNGTLPSASYTLNPVPTTSPPTSSSPPSSGAGNSGGSSKSSTSSNTSSKSSTTTSPTSTTTAPASSGAVTATPSLGSLSISVINNQNKPILGAKVGLDNKQFIYTNVNGLANFVSVSSGPHVITITDPGKKTTQTELTLQPGENKLVSLKLISDTSNTAEIILTIIIVLAVLSFCAYWVIKTQHNHPKSLIPDSQITIGDASVKPKTTDGSNIAPTVIQPGISPTPKTETNIIEPEIHKNDLHPPV